MKLLVLFCISYFVYEILFILASIALYKRQKILSPILSGLLEALKLGSWFLAIDNLDRTVAIIAGTILTVISHRLGLELQEYLEKRYGEKDES